MFMEYFQRFILLFFTLLCLLYIVESINIDVDLSLDRSNWIDPNDPLSGNGHTRLASSNLLADGENICDGHCEQFTEENKRLKRMYADLENSREHSVDVLLKHILVRIIANLNIDLNSSDDVYRNAYVHLLPENLRIIRRYLSSQKASEEFGLREDLRFVLEDFIIELNSENSLFSALYAIVPYITILNAILLPAIIWIIFRSILSVRHFTILVLIVAFFISCYSTYARKYQEVLAQRFERIDKKSNSHCTPNGLLSEAYNVLLSFIRIKEKSECLQHYEDVLIEPIFLIDPLQVIAEVLSNFVLTPISVCGNHLNKFFNDFFINTPVYLMLVKCVFLLLLLFYLTGYRIRTIFATIEPAETINLRFTSPSLTSSNQKFLRNGSDISLPSNIAAFQPSIRLTDESSIHLANDLKLTSANSRESKSIQSQKDFILSNKDFVKKDYQQMKTTRNLGFKIENSNFQSGTQDYHEKPVLYPNFRNWKQKFYDKDSDMDLNFDDSRVTHRRPHSLQPLNVMKRSHSLGRT